MDTDRHQHQAPARWSSPCGQREPTRALPFSHHHNAAKLCAICPLTLVFPLALRDWLCQTARF
ncbi:hypothetical protein, partial [Escherichia coli]|uniref:hypothetical protein n=1 Tax=Escherichia coli TaxID=562 RepID=UPI001EDAB80F